MKDEMGNPRWVTADLVDIIDGGCGLELMSPLKSGSTVVVRGKLGENHTAGQLKAGVRWCIRKTGGTFRAGLEFPERQQTDPISPDTLDCYEVMQLSPNADPGTIARVYRMLASRYHPDNAETGNSEMFIRLSEAYQILSNPEKRARYDARRRGDNRLPWMVVESASIPAGGATRQRLDVMGAVRPYRRGEEKGEHVRPSVGALGGWNSALRCP
jgi:hypothetical protein